MTLCVRPPAFLSTQINAGVRQHDMKYSHFIHALAASDVQLNRKVLADLAVFEPFSFKAVVETARLGAAASGELK
jgi:large subunit ribosomal protein L20